MKKGKRLAALCLLAALLLAGCSTAPVLGGNVEELLRAPQAGQAQSEVLSALAAYTGGTPQLKYPRGGDEDDPMQFADFDGDGQQEAAVLYLPEEGTANVCLAVLEQTETGWQVASSAEGLAAEVAQLSMQSFREEGVQLLVGYANANLTDRYLAIYQYTGDGLTLLARQPYEQCLAVDLTGDGCADLAVAQAGQPGGVTLQFWTLRNGVFGQVQTLTFPQDVVGCDSLQASRYGSRRGLVADMRTSAGGWASVVLAVQNGHLAFWPQGIGQELLSQTARTVEDLAPRDLEGSGTVCVAQVRRTLLAEEGARRIYQVVWYNYLLPEVPQTQFGVYDSATGLFVRLPTVWSDGRITLEVDADTGIWRVRTTEDDTLLMSVRTAEEGETLGNYVRLAGRDGVQVMAYFTAACTDAQRTLIASSCQYLT